MTMVISCFIPSSVSKAYQKLVRPLERYKNDSNVSEICGDVIRSKKLPRMRFPPYQLIKIKPRPFDVLLPRQNMQILTSRSEFDSGRMLLFTSFFLAGQRTRLNVIHPDSTLSALPIRVDNVTHTTTTGMKPKVNELLTN